MIFLYRFSESIAIATVVTFLAQLHAADCFSSPRYPASPPALQLPKSQVQEAVVAAGPRWLLQQPGLHSYILFHSGTKLSVVRHRAADRSGSNRILEADWLQIPAVVVEFR